MHFDSPILHCLLIFRNSISSIGEEAGAELIHAVVHTPGGPYYEGDARVTSIEGSKGGSTTIKFEIVPGSWQKWIKGQPDFKSKEIEQPLPLQWSSSFGMVPVATGMHVSIRTTLAHEVIVIGYRPGEVRAARRTANGKWEFIINPMNEKFFLRLVPRAFDPTFTEVRWAKDIGIVIAEFPDGGYGGGEQPGVRILPGRDGWTRWTFHYFENSIENAIVELTCKFESR